MAWTDARNGLNDVYGARVSSAGVLLDATGVPISNDGNIQQVPAIACNGAECLVAWEDFRAAGVSAY